MSFDGFTNGRRDFLGNLVAGDSGPLDTICSKVRELLQADSRIAAFFHAIHRYDERPFGIYGGMPRLHIFPGAFDPVRGPTSLEVGDVEIVISLVAEAGKNVPLDDWEVGWSGIIRDVQNVLRANTQLSDTIGGVSGPLAYTSRPGPYSVFEDVDPDGRRRAKHRDFGWIYRIKIDDTTGQLEAFS